MQAIEQDPNDATLFSNRSLCLLRMGDGQRALLDALDCRGMRPDWPKACYRQGAALMLLKVGLKVPPATLFHECKLFVIINLQAIIHHQDYKSACEALDGFKLDPENAEMECALRYPST